MKLQYKFLIFIILYISILTACKTDMNEVAVFSAEDNSPDLYARTYETNYTTNAKRAAKLSAPSVKKFMTEDPYFEFDEGITLLFYDENKNVKTKITANYAFFFEEKELGKASGDVVITNADSTVLRTEEIFIDQKGDKIYSKQFVKINESSGYEIVGKQGFESNLDFTIYKFWKSVGVIPFEGEFEDFGEMQPKK